MALQADRYPIVKACHERKTIPAELYPQLIAAAKVFQVSDIGPWSCLDLLRIIVQVHGPLPEQNTNDNSNDANGSKENNCPIDDEGTSHHPEAPDPKRHVGAEQSGAGAGAEVFHDAAATLVDDGATSGAP